MSIRRGRQVFRIGLIGLGLLGLAACQTSSPYRDGDPGIEGPRPNFPVRQEGAAGYTGDTEVVAQTPQAATPAPPSPAPSPPPAIETQALPPLQAEAPPAPPPPPPPVVAQAPPPPPAPVFRVIAAGPVVDADGPPRTYTVRRGDTLTQIAREMGTTVAFLRERNNISNPSAIRPGQRINGPASRGKAYVVQSGDTLSAIGRRFNVSPSQIAAANSMGVNDVIRPNQRLMLPAGYRDSGPQQEMLAQANEVLRLANAAPPPPPPPARSPAPPVIPPVASAAPATVSELRTLAAGRFVWPVDGQLIGGFGARATGQASNGLSISAAPGTGVRAAAAGTVRYADDTLPDFGNLVLVQHPDGFITVYGHLSRMDVREGDVVRQSQVLGQVGQTGNVTEPQLYFEVRHQANASTSRPIDPQLVLPAR